MQQQLEQYIQKAKEIPLSSASQVLPQLAELQSLYRRRDELKIELPADGEPPTDELSRKLNDIRDAHPLAAEYADIAVHENEAVRTTMCHVILAVAKGLLPLSAIADVRQYLDQ